MNAEEHSARHLQNISINTSQLSALIAEMAVRSRAKRRVLP
jgi:hypothetical protein